MAVERITIVLNERESAALRGVAQADLRKPRDQARYLLRLALGLAEQPETRNRGAMDCDPQRTAAAS